MKTVNAVALLTIIFLSAGAFAENTSSLALIDEIGNANVTVIAKNQSWPLAGRITVESCNYVRCYDI